MDYSLLIVVAAGMTKMATGDDSPLRQGAEKGLDWYSVATEPCDGGTYDLGLTPDGVSIYRIFWHWFNAKMGLEVITTHRGKPGPPGAPWWVVLTSVASCTPSLHY